MIDEQMKKDLSLLLQRMKLNSADIEGIVSDLDSEAQKPEAIKSLRKNRYVLLDEIHDKQKLLDNLDFTINKLKKN